MAVKHGIDTENIPDEFKIPEAIKQRAAEERYRMFAHFYVHNGLNGAEAARRCGYAESVARQTATELLTIPYVVQWVTKLQEDKKAAAVVTYDYIVKGLEEARQACITGKTNEKGLYDAKGIAQVSDVLNKMHGYNAPAKHLVLPIEDKDPSKAEMYLAQFRKAE